MLTSASKETSETTKPASKPIGPFLFGRTSGCQLATEANDTVSRSNGAIVNYLVK